MEGMFCPVFSCCRFVASDLSIKPLELELEVSSSISSDLGSLFGVTSCIECLAALTAPIMYGTIYQVTVVDNPMFVFKLMAGLTAIPAALVL